MNKITCFLILLLVGSVFSCTSQESGTEAAPQEPVPTEEKVVVEIEKPAAYAEGKSSYNTICAACHMPTGQGVPGLNPPLTGTEWVMGDKERLIGIILNGFNEEIEIDGDRYANEMAALDYLSDEEIANILTFVRFEFGRHSDEISAEEVAAVRAASS